jgi:magnesium chelatase family protein
VLPIAIEARNQGRAALFVPEENAAEASVVEGIRVYGAKNLRDLWTFLQLGHGMQPVVSDMEALFAQTRRDEGDFSDVRGQLQVKRAIEVGVAGSHNLLMIGPPGSGKSMLAKRIPSIMPPMSLEEAIETTKIHSICGLLDGKRAFVSTRPFRSPHHTISDVGLLGGSVNPTPGEVSLAHHGVLFLDELPEFKRNTLEVMRQPLEDGKVTISRAAGSMTFPAEFMLVAAMNPCPCGFYGDPKRECRCAPGQVERYRQRISGPLLDRIDIHIEVPAVEYKDLSSTEPGEPSAAMSERVVEARMIQQARFRSTSGHRAVTANARMTSRQIKQHCALDSEGMDLIKMAMSELGLSARAYDRILKVSRTIADLAGSERVQGPHVMEAIQYRTLDRRLWS